MLRGIVSPCCGTLGRISPQNPPFKTNHFPPNQIQLSNSPLPPPKPLPKLPRYQNPQSTLLRVPLLPPGHHSPPPSIQTPFLTLSQPYHPLSLESRDWRVAYRSRPIVISPHLPHYPLRNWRTLPPASQIQPFPPKPLQQQAIQPFPCLNLQRSKPLPSVKGRERRVIIWSEHKTRRINTP
jgi:hypothetical protein